MNMTHRLVPLLAALALTAAAGLPQAANAKTTVLGATPPDLTTSVAPNIAITFDDSGSMQSNYMGDNRPFDDKGWGNVWRCAGVIDPRVTDPNDPKSLAMNGVYFNPNITYTPPSRFDGTRFPDADATLKAVWLNGIDVNRTKNPADVLPAAAYDNVNSDSGYQDGRVGNLRDSNHNWSCVSGGTSPLDGSTKDANGIVYNGGPYYYRLKSSVVIKNSDGTINTTNLYKAANWEFVGVPASKYQDFANWYAYYRTRNMMTRTAMSQAFAKIGNSIRIAWQNMANSNGDGKKNLSTKFGTTATLQDIGDLTSPVRSSFYDWLLQVAGGNTTPARTATIRASEIFRASVNLTTATAAQLATDPYWNGLTAAKDRADLTCRKNFHMLVTDGYWNENEPTNAPSDFGTSTIADNAQTLPDSRSYSPTASYSRIYGNTETPVYTLSMANIAWYYWRTDMRTDLANNVKPFWQDLTSASPVSDDDPGANNDVYWNPSNDPATWQHVDQFYVTLGVAGTLNYPGDLPALIAGTKQWPRPANNSAEALDDTWHGAINSRGGYFSASNPTTLVNSLVAIINSVVATNSSAVSASLDSGVLNTNSNIYVPGFSSADWSGTLKAFPVTSTGGRGTQAWEAGELLTKTASTARKIVTSKGPGAKNGVEFLYANLSSTQQAIMDASDPDDTATNPDNLGLNRVNWIRGSQADEGTLLRTRQSLLGAIINGQPLYVGYPSSGYRDFFPGSGTTDSPEVAAYKADSTKSYSQFVADNLTRSPTLYVPANDGMLHALDVSTPNNGGPERWAYIPDAVYRNLWFLPKKAKTYAPTVDATPISRDVFFSGAWHTILVGGLRYGGRGIYALDITNPTAGTAAAAASKVLWEFNSNSTGGANLGYTFGQPNIGRLSNGKWVVLVPAGYFPDDSTVPGHDAAAASNKYSSLFVLDAATGAVLAEYQTPTTVGASTIESWGLSSPVLGDYNNDQIDDVAFAGDLAGNLWRFDLRDLSKKTVDLIYQPAVSADPTHPDQPITVMPRLFPDPTSQYFIVVFGTGKFLGTDDRTTTGAKVQSVYGVRDPGVGNTTGLPWTRSNLVQQTLVEDANGLRGLTQNTVPTTSLKGGWYFDLNISGVLGEKVVVTPSALFNTNRAIITTLIPTTADPCSPGRAGALMVIDATTGGAAAGVSGTSAFGNAKYVLAGSRVDNPPATGTLPAATMIGGGQVLVPGVTMQGTNNAFSVGAPIWRRRSWRILNDQ